VNAIVYSDVIMSAYKVESEIYKATWELLQDSAYDIGADIADHMGESVGRQLNYLLTLGTGGGSQPTGIVTAVGTPNTTTISNAASVAGRLPELGSPPLTPAYRKGPKTGWMFNTTPTRLQARQLKDTIGQYYWQPALTAGDEPTLFGYKYVIQP